MAVEVRCIGDQDITAHQLRVRGYVPRDKLQSGQQFAPALETVSVNLIAAADQISTQIVFAAVGADTKEYEASMIEQVQTKRNILWIHKLLKEEEYVQLYSGARVFVCPSVYDALRHHEPGGHGVQGAGGGVGGGRDLRGRVAG